MTGPKSSDPIEKAGRDAFWFTIAWGAFATLIFGAMFAVAAFAASMAGQPSEIFVYAGAFWASISTAFIYLEADKERSRAKFREWVRQAEKNVRARAALEDRT